MTSYKIPKQIIFEFAERLLSEAGVGERAIEDDLESFIYEAGQRGWDESEDGDFWYIPDYED